jgi:hypothetical protein
MHVAHVELSQVEKDAGQRKHKIRTDILSIGSAGQVKTGDTCQQNIITKGISLNITKGILYSTEPDDPKTRSVA